MTTPLNSPLEVGVRVFMLLAEAIPETLDVNRLVLLDHAVLHSEDLGGPTSLHPPLPIRAGEFGMRRHVLTQGLDVMIQAGLVEAVVAVNGIEFGATDRAPAFTRVLESSYARRLQNRSRWAISNFGDLDQDSLRQSMRDIFAAWSEEFDDSQGPT